MADGLAASTKRPRRRVTRASSWREYERRKQEFLRDCPYPTPEAYEQFIRKIGAKLGL